ncbi:GL21592 [Drosophila persimilis]|uniref:GL21592 n=1 Tax=Drosophila persimilis TaxID=7234 RepID=B4H6W6_DROPE|nr:GL21592 [Drosophila persimilis]
MDTRPEDVSTPKFLGKTLFGSSLNFFDIASGISLLQIATAGHVGNGGRGLELRRLLIASTSLKLFPQLKEIRNHTLIQHFSPYKSADMYKIALAFNISESDLENKVMRSF